MRTTEDAGKTITSPSTSRYRGLPCARRAFYQRNEGRGCEVNRSGFSSCYAKEQFITRAESKKRSHGLRYRGCIYISGDIFGRGISSRNTLLLPLVSLLNMDSRGINRAQLSLPNHLAQNCLRSLLPAVGSRRSVRSRLLIPPSCFSPLNCAERVDPVFSPIQLQPMSIMTAGGKPRIQQRRGREGGREGKNGEERDDKSESKGIKCSNCLRRVCGRYQGHSSSWELQSCFQ